MTIEEKLMVLKSMVEADEGEDSLLLAYLSMARSKILNRMYPFGIPETVEEVPSRYDNLHIEIASYLYNKRGSEGESSRTENGVTRVFGGSDVPEAMMREITPKGMVL